MTTSQEEISLTYAPPDLWNRRQETGKSAADIFQENGLTLVKSSNDRVSGWYALKEWLSVYETQDEQTGDTKQDSLLKIFKNCKNLIRRLPQLQRDEKDPNDVANEPHEITHAPDALRYFCVMRTYPSKSPRKPLKDGFYLPSELEDMGYKKMEIKKVR